MQLTNLLSALALARAASAECFPNGEAWGADTSTPLVFAKNLCATGALAGAFGPDAQRPALPSEKRKCVDWDGRKANFWVYHRKPGFANLTADACYDGLKKEVAGCAKGGKTFYVNWAYR